MSLRASWIPAETESIQYLSQNSFIKYKELLIISPCSRPHAQDFLRIPLVCVLF